MVFNIAVSDNIQAEVKKAVQTLGVDYAEIHKNFIKEIIPRNLLEP